MSESKLPTGPWRVVGDGERAIAVVDGDQSVVLAAGTPDSWLAASPEVLRAIEALPLLVEAARGAMEASKNPADPYRAWKLLREALALVDGEGRRDG